MSSQKQQRILVYRTGQIGDTIVALPAFWAIRKHFPLAHLALLTGRHSENGFVLANEVLPRFGLFEEVITYRTELSGLRPSQMPRILSEIRRKRFDSLAYLAPRVRTRWQVRRDLLFFRSAGIRSFLGHKAINALPSRTEAGALPEVENEVDHLLNRLSVSGISIPPRENRELDLCLTRPEHDRAVGWLRAQLGAGLAGRLIAIGPGSKFQSKLWPEERFGEIGEHLVRSGFYPIIFGGAEDRDLGTRLIGRWRTGANAAGQLKVRESAALLSHCSLFIGNDNGTMHLAAAAGVPCVAIFSGIDWPGRWHPYGTHHVVLRKRVPCDGCQLRVCSQNDLICLKQISVNDVLAAIEHQLSRNDGKIVKSNKLTLD